MSYQYVSCPTDDWFYGYGCNPNLVYTSFPSNSMAATIGFSFGDVYSSFNKDDLIFVSSLPDGYDFVLVDPDTNMTPESFRANGYDTQVLAHSSWVWGSDFIAFETASPTVNPVSDHSRVIESLDAIYVVLFLSLCFFSILFGWRLMLIR